MSTPPQKRFCRDSNSKREDCLDWQDYFMATASLAAKRSKDPSTQVGACIVNQKNVIVGVGYNGMPRGCSDDKFPWCRKPINKVENKYLYVCHAELNAIVNKNSADLENCTIYVTLFPCNECAKLIIQSGIKKIFYMSDKDAHKPATKASKKMFKAAEVTYEQFTPKKEEIVIDFFKISQDDKKQLPETPEKSD